MRVSELKIGHYARILALGKGGHKAYRQRLLAMGLLPGTLFSVLRLAPLGDPMEILVRGVALSLRKSEADLLEVEVVSHDD